MITLDVTFTSIYEGGEESVVATTLKVEAPPEGFTEDELEMWADDVLFPYTGTGRTEGDAGYFAKITACPDMDELTGAEFEWGT